MIHDFSSPLSILFAAFLTLLTRIPRPKVPLPRILWPKIKIQTERQTCHGIQVTDVVLNVSGQRWPRTNAGKSEPAFEGAIYFVWKRKK